MTRLVLVLAAWCLNADLNAQDLKTPAKELEGVWQEPAPPGESPGLRYTITFSSDKLTLSIGKQVMQGTWRRVELEERQPTITITFEVMDGELVVERTVRTATYLVIGGELHLCLASPSFERSSVSVQPVVGPPRLIDLEARARQLQLEPAEARSVGQGMPLAPITLRLEKVKK